MARPRRTVEFWILTSEAGNDAAADHMDGSHVCDHPETTARATSCEPLQIIDAETYSTTSRPNQAIQRCRSNTLARRLAATPISTTESNSPVASTQVLPLAAPATASTLSRLI